MLAHHVGRAMADLASGDRVTWSGCGLGDQPWPVGALPLCAAAPLGLPHPRAQQALGPAVPTAWAIAAIGVIACVRWSQARWHALRPCAAAANPCFSHIILPWAIAVI